MKRLFIFVMIALSFVCLAGCKISGVVTEDGIGLEGVTMTMEINKQPVVFKHNGENTIDTETTDEDGVYMFNIPLADTLTITPTLEGYRFEPEMVVVTYEVFAKGAFQFDFQAFPTCRNIPWEGDYLIEDMEDLEDLAGYSTVTGNLTIHGVSSLEGLQCLTTIGGSLVIENTDLVTLDGLNGLETISSSLFINSNQQLEDILTGLEHLTAVNGVVVITNNPNISLSQTDALTGQLVDYIGGWF